jgi:hypothetical protein
VSADHHPPHMTEAEIAAYRAEHGLDADNFPPLTAAERKAAMNPTPPAPASPTGVAVIAPTGIAFKVLLVVVAIATAVSLKQPDLFPSTDLDQQIATILVAILGFISPGLRKSAA